MLGRMPEIKSRMAGVWICRKTPDGWEHLQLLRAPGRYAPNTWSLCRGGIEPGETAEQAARRELREETELAPAPGGFYRLGTVEMFHTTVDDTIHLCPFFVAVVRAEDRVVLNPEHTAYRWVPDTEIDAALTWPNEHLLLTDVRRYVLAGHPSLGLMRLGTGV